MFDTVLGLPVHPLVVHAVVVLLPLACVITVLVAVRPAWRRWASWLIVLNGVVMVAAFAAKESGEKLEHRIRELSVPAGLEDHEKWGSRLFLLSVVMFLGAIVIWVTRERPGLARVVSLVAVIVAVATVAVTLEVGHSGATMVWKDLISNTKG